jgi:aryl-alcohol dehydrogenase-like predicted oxidoreductase
MADLELRRLGAHGPQVTVLGYGAMELRGTPHRRPRPLSEDIAAQVLTTVLDEGINFIDTSIDYGSSEELIGRYLSPRRDEFVLASKAGCPLKPQLDANPGLSLVHDYSAENIRAGVEQSLRRLRTDHLDLLQVHISPAAEVLHRDGVIETLIALRDTGKVRAIGISSTLPNLDDHSGIEEFTVFQLPYSALERDVEERLGALAGGRRGVIIRGGVAQGGSRPKLRSGGGRGAWADAGLDDLLDGDTPQGFLLRFVLSHPAVTTTIVGTADPEHLRANLRAARRGPLPAQTYNEALRRLDHAGFRPAPYVTAELA